MNWFHQICTFWFREGWKKNKIHINPNLYLAIVHSLSLWSSISIVSEIECRYLMAFRCSFDIEDDDQVHIYRHARTSYLARHMVCCLCRRRSPRMHAMQLLDVLPRFRIWGSFLEVDLSWCKTAGETGFVRRNLEREEGDTEQAHETELPHLWNGTNSYCNGV